MALWFGPQILSILMGIFLLMCWGMLSAKWLKQRKQATWKFIFLHLIAILATFLGILDDRQGSWFSVIGLIVYQSIWPLAVQLTALFDTQVTAYYSQIPWTVYVVSFILLGGASAVGMTIKCRILKRMEGGDFNDT